ncbi:hypothetical protein L9W92_16715 [Pelotomaculum terephthalicicum JT]|uniref:hypothetical protein n=1 Tax=Pelotomaculum TaxID=191373 RepID=UPI0009C874C6|nr:MULTISPECIES: hypothetical protein [Pelotomaculum]MCG9969648.1 hypothetical protein [Pelotomaculum terephthalicicum JT]OPX87629.1 MAG: hypothetical protein A4E54_01580 [Pelotomaculum sp. PtaB.Bin117]OPY59638.1 MAG: hypothetical protein A4E56_03126 [Pelotomaculum sp. PtaU1.Bin065]
MAQGKLRLKNKERTLLLNSQVIEDYPWFHDLLKSNQRITEELIDSLSIDYQRFFDNMLNKVIGQATVEWEGNPQHPVDDLEDKRTPCTLCGQPTRWVFYIFNKWNGKNINVGSECVKHFGISVDKTGLTVDQLTKRATRAMDFRANELVVYDKTYGNM